MDNEQYLDQLAIAETAYEEARRRFVTLELDVFKARLHALSVGAFDQANPSHADVVRRLLLELAEETPFQQYTAIYKLAVLRGNDTYGVTMTSTSQESKIEAKIIEF
jgi:hypothetical protein